MNKAQKTINVKAKGEKKDEQDVVEVSPGQTELIVEPIAA